MDLQAFVCLTWSTLFQCEDSEMAPQSPSHAQGERLSPAHGSRLSNHVNSISLGEYSFTVMPEESKVYLIPARFLELGTQSWGPLR